MAHKLEHFDRNKNFEFASPLCQQSSPTIMYVEQHKITGDDEDAMMKFPRKLRSVIFEGKGRSRSGVGGCANQLIESKLKEIYSCQLGGINMKTSETVL